MSIACQGDIDVELPSGQLRPCMLYLATIAESGERKTTTDNLVCAPIYEHDAKRKAAHTEAVIAYEADLYAWDAVNAAIQRKISKSVVAGDDATRFRSELIAHARIKPSKPVRDRIIFESVTQRPFMEALRGDGVSLAILSDEGEIVFKGGAMNNLGILNRAWDGAKSLTLDRADDSIEVTNPRVTVSFMVQAGVFQEFMEKRGGVARASGHLARYLVAQPVSTQGFRYMALEEASWEHLPAFHSRVRELLESASSRRASSDRSRKVLSFAPEAKETWAQKYNEIEQQLMPNGLLVGVRDFASKSMELVSRVAAIFHHFSGQAGSVISLDTLKRAIEVVWWYFEEFSRLLGDPAFIPEYQKDAASLWRYLCEICARAACVVVARNDVRKCGPIRHQGRFEAALAELLRCGLISASVQGRKHYITVLRDVVTDSRPSPPPVPFWCPSPVLPQQPWMPGYGASVPTV